VAREGANPERACFPDVALHQSARIEEVARHVSAARG
jgi:hypothetical protein